MKNVIFSVFVILDVGIKVFSGNKPGNQETSVFVGFLCTEQIWNLPRTHPRGIPLKIQADLPIDEAW